MGIYNMGNTCYMNSAMQCLANIKLFHHYYVDQEIHRSQINRNNVLGYKGKLVSAFAGIINQMWNSKQVIVPKGFRHTLAGINENFGGSE